MTWISNLPLLGTADSATCRVISLDGPGRADYLVAFDLGWHGQIYPYMTFKGQIKVTELSKGQIKVIEFSMGCIAYTKCHSQSKSHYLNTSDLGGHICQVYNIFIGHKFCFVHVQHDAGHQCYDGSFLYLYIYFLFIYFCDVDRWWNVSLAYHII